MRFFKFFWTTHKWTGIVLATVFLLISVTGFLLLLKKDYDALHPPTELGAAGELADFVSLQRVLGAVLAREHPDFRSMDDIDRVDFRPGRRVHKVRSKHHHSEIQVDAVTGEVLSVGSRTSDWIESLHDGSFFGAWAHDWLMPMVAVGLSFLVFSGLYIWSAPLLRKRSRRLASQRAAASQPESRS